MICRKCKQNKPADKFGSNKTRCKKCLAAYAVEYNHRIGKSKTYAGQPRRDLTGKKIGMLTVLKDLGTRNKNKHRFWLCKCECGNKKEINHTHLANHKQRSCGCLHNRIGSSNPCWRGCGEISGDFWDHIKRKRRHAEKRIFDITIEQIWKLFLRQNRKCALSGIELQMGKQPTASLDRIDSTIGYTINNVQWVHKDVNRMKNVYSQVYFIQMCQKIAKNHKQKRSRTCQNT